MDMKRYYTPKDTPLKYHKFLRYVSLPLSMLLTVLNIIEMLREGDFSFWVYTVDMLYALAAFGLAFTAFIGCFSWTRYAWYALISIPWFSALYTLYSIVLYSVYLPSEVAAAIASFIMYTVLGILVSIYYSKRRPLFFCSGEFEDDAPTFAPPTARPCPSCGQMMAPEQDRCEYCGFVRIKFNSTARPAASVTDSTVGSSYTSADSAAPEAGTGSKPREVQQPAWEDQPRKFDKEKKKRLITGLLIAGACILALIFVLIINLDNVETEFRCDMEITNAEDRLYLNMNDEYQLEWSLENEMDKEPFIQWVSSNDAIASVSVNGRVRGKTPGTATIIAYINDIEKERVTVVVARDSVPVKNGEMIVTPKRTDYPEVIINAPKEQNCFAYFKNLDDRENDFAFYVQAGSSVTVNAPVGTYEFYYATGDVWYGTENKFGDGTEMFKDPELVVLTQDDESYDVIEWKLRISYSGNLVPEEVDASDFPV